MASRLLPVELKPVHVSNVDASFARSGVYFLMDQGTVVYVGQSAHILRRVGEHIADCRKRFDSVAVHFCNALNRLWMERIYITQYKPRYNGRDPDRRPHRKRRRRRRSLVPQP